VTWDDFEQNDKVVIDNRIDSGPDAWGHIICLGTDGCTVRNPETGREYEVYNPRHLLKLEKK
jgi:hypothetical protein